MRRYALAVLVGVVGASAGGAWAEPLDARVVPADAAWVLHVDLDALRASEVGSAVLDGVVDERHGEGLAKLSSVVGFDVRENLRGATLYGEGFTREATAMLIRVAGDTGNLAGLMLAAPGYESEEVGGRIVHSFIAEDKVRGDARMWATLEPVGKDTLVVASYDRGLLDEALAQAVSPEGRGAGMEASPGAGSVLYAKVSGLDTAELGPSVERPGVLRLVKDLTVDIGEAAGRVEAEAEAEVQDEARANQVRQFVQGVLAMAQLGDPADPKAAAVAALAQRAAVTQEGAVVKVTLDASAAEVVRQIESTTP